MHLMHEPQVVPQNSITYTLPFSMPLTGSPFTQVSTLSAGAGLPMVSGSAATTPADPRARRTAKAKLMHLIEVPLTHGDRSLGVLTEEQVGVGRLPGQNLEGEAPAEPAAPARQEPCPPATPECHAL